jgi:hypothetical protein
LLWVKLWPEGSKVLPTIRFLRRARFLGQGEVGGGLVPCCTVSVDHGADFADFGVGRIL